MTVKELREELAGYPDDAIVHLAQPSHNHWDNVAAPVLDHVGQVDVVFSEYLRQPQVVPSDYNAEDYELPPNWVVILSDSHSTVDV